MSTSYDNGAKKGLYFANMGSVYDLPQTSRADNRTQAATSDGGAFSAQYKPLGFEKTERAIRKQPFDTFYTTNMTNAPDGKPEKVMYQ